MMEKTLVKYTANAIHNVATLMHMTEQQKRAFIPGIQLRADQKVTVTDIFGTQLHHP